MLSSLRPALRAAVPILVPDETIAGRLSDALEDRSFESARRNGLSSLPLTHRHGLNRVTGEVAESVAELLLAEVGLTVFWHITTPGMHGVDLLFLCPDESVLALEVKGTLRPASLPRLTPSRLRQMSREWLNGPDNPAMAEWEFSADDLYAGVMVVDLAGATARVAVGADFETFAPVSDLTELSDVDGLTAS